MTRQTKVKNAQDVDTDSQKVSKFFEVIMRTVIIALRPSSKEDSRRNLIVIA